jgi:GT2 family glycosyltransferase
MCILCLSSALLVMMKQQKKGFTIENFVIFIYIYIYVKFKLYKRPPDYYPRGDLINHLFKNSLKIWKQLGWINIKFAKQVGIKSLN